MFVYKYFSHNMCVTDFLGNAFDRDDCVEHRSFLCMFHTCLKRQFPRKAGKAKAFKLSSHRFDSCDELHQNMLGGPWIRGLGNYAVPFLSERFLPITNYSYPDYPTSLVRLDRKVRKSWNLLRGQIAVSMVLGTSFRKLRIWVWNSVQDCSGDFDDLPPRSLT